MKGSASLEHTLAKIRGVIVPIQYGGLSVVDGATVQTVEGAAEKIVNWAVARPAAGGVVSDAANDRIVSGSAGDYEVTLQVSWVTGLGATVWTFHIRVGAVESGLSVQRSVAAAGRVGSASALGVLTLPAAAVLEIYAEHPEGADRELTMAAAQFSIHRVGS